MTSTDKGKRKQGHAGAPAATGDERAVILVTGFPSYLARRVAAELIARRPGALLYLLHDGSGTRLDAFLKTLPEADRGRVVPLTGHVAHMDLGLPSDEYRRLMGEVTEIHHLASAYAQAGSGQGERLRKVNIQGTRELVELAGQCTGLRRLAHWSTVHVSGCRQGVVMEDDLEQGQRFHNTWEQTRYEAERLVARAARKLPVTVLRPGVVVGDSATGEIEAYDGPWRLLSNFLAAPRDQPALLPGSGQAPVHFVPVDFVVRAGVHLAGDPAAAGRTFHLVDPAPLPAGQVYQLVARKAHRKPEPASVPKALSRFLRLHPRMERLARLPVAPPEIFDQLVFYNALHTLSFLEGTGIRCPSLPTYAERLVAFAKSNRPAPSAEEEGPADPLA